jgi:hypothetical protein
MSAFLRSLQKISNPCMAPEHAGRGKSCVSLRIVEASELVNDCDSDEVKAKKRAATKGYNTYALFAACDVCGGCRAIESLSKDLLTTTGSNRSLDKCEE